MRSIFLKLFGSYFLLVIALSGLIVLSASWLIRNYQLQRTEQELRDIALIIGSRLVESSPDRSIDDRIKKLGRQIHTRITLVDSEGRVIADSEEDPARMVNHRMRTEIAQAFLGEAGRYLRFSETLGQEMLYIAIPVRTSTGVTYVVRTSKFLRDIKIVSRQLNARISVVAGIVLILAMIAAFIFARTISDPVGQLTEAIRRVSGHDFAVRILMKSRGELKGVADSFNAMTDEMQGLFAELSRQKEELNSIISSLQEGLLVIDNSDRVMFTNDSLKNFAGHDPETGRFYWETLREPAISDLIRKVRSERQNRTEELEISRMTFLCSATFLTSKEEIILVFHDISEIKKLEKIKSDFVLNVSHELRTPLTSIKGYTETMDEETLSDDNKHYLAIIRRNTDRLINIVNDLLMLSKLEEKNAAMNLEPVDLPHLIGSVLRLFDNQVKEKHFSVTVNASADLPPVAGDAFKLEQVFINLLDNAIKYTDTGGITIEMRKEDGTVITTITDTGPGIPPEHIPRIFERFYVADKSRSKKLGGTGLGLSIVKHIVLLHNGRIGVQSTMGKGTTFTVTLPASVS